jgi:hypothetical protein
MIEDVMVRNPSPATCQSHLGAVKALHHLGSSPDRLGMAEVR